jgi:transcriptional regulator with XRE-family HTH domain
MSPEMNFDERVGEWVRGQREALGLTQVQLAGLMRRKAQRWERSTVTKTEGGRRSLTLEEAYAFQEVLSEVRLWPDVEHQPDQLVNTWVLSVGDHFQHDVGPEMYGSGPDEETQRVAAALEVDAAWLDAWTAEHWHCPWPEERDRRALAAAEEAGATSLRAFRGHASRVMMAEVREDLAGLTKAQRRQAVGHRAR